MDERELARREAELRQKEQELADRETKVEEKENIVYKNAKERFYDNIKIPVKYIDLFIGVCLAGILLCLVLGWLKGHGYF